MDLTLYVDAFLTSPYALTAFVALEEGPPVPARTGRPEHGGTPRRLPRRLPHRTRPGLRHGDCWLAESSAIGEYLGETFPLPSTRASCPED